MNPSTNKVPRSAVVALMVVHSHFPQSIDDDMFEHDLCSRLAEVEAAQRQAYAAHTTKEFRLVRRTRKSLEGIFR